MTHEHPPQCSRQSEATSGIRDVVRALFMLISRINRDKWKNCESLFKRSNNIKR